MPSKVQNRPLDVTDDGSDDVEARESLMQRCFSLLTLPLVQARFHGQPTVPTRNMPMRLRLSTTVTLPLTWTSLPLLTLQKAN